MTVQEIAAAVAAIDDDHALSEALADLLRSKAPNLCSKLSPRRKMTARALPTPQSIMAAQCSVFDNWIEFGGQRPKRGEPGHYRDRFKVEMQFWTWTEADVDWNNCAWHGKAHLWSAKDFKARLNGKGMKLPKALTDDFKQYIAVMSEEMEGYRIGLPYTKDGKTLLYNDDCALVVATESDLLSHKLNKIMVRTALGTFEFDEFRAQTSKGRPLTGNCFAHSRMTTKPALASKWDATLFSHQPAPSRDEAALRKGDAA